MVMMVVGSFPRFAGQYGTKDLVNQYAAQLVATCLQNCASDPRVGTFQRFLMEEWDTRVLCAYMDGEPLSSVSSIWGDEAGGGSGVMVG